MASWSDVGGASEGPRLHHGGDDGAGNYVNGGGGHGGDPWHDGDHGGDPWHGNDEGLPGGEGGRDGSSAAGWSWTNDGTGSVGRREQDPDDGSQYLGSTSSRRRRGKRGSGGKQQQQPRWRSGQVPFPPEFNGDVETDPFCLRHYPCVDGCGSPKSFFLRTSKHFELWMP